MVMPNNRLKLFPGAVPSTFPQFRQYVDKAAVSIAEKNREREEEKKKLPKAARSLTPLRRRVLELARRHPLGLQVNIKAVVQALAGDTEFNRRDKNLTELETSVKSALVHIRKKGFLPGSKKRLPTLRRVTQGQIQRYLPIIDEVLTFRTKHFGGLVNRWKGVMSRGEVHSVGTDGLIRAIETFDKKKGQEFKRYGYMKVASAIAEEVRKRLKQKYRPKEVQFREDLELPAEATADKASTQAINPALRRIFQWREKGIIGHRSSVVLALRHAYGHRQKAIGEHFGLSESNICLIEKAAGRKIREAIREE